MAQPHSAVPESEPASSDPIPTGRGAPWWLWLQVLALDAPLVAVLWQWMLAESHRVSLPWPFVAALVVATWLIYLLDRTLDLFHHGGPPATARHRFCQRHLRPLVLVVIPGLLWGLGWLGFSHLPSGLLWSGMAVATLTGVYLAVFVVRAGSRWQLLVLFAVCAGFTMLLAPLSLPPLLRFVAYGLVVLICFTLATRGVSAAFHRHFPKEVFGALLFALGCGAGVHFWVYDGHSWLCAETLMLWALGLMNLTSITVAELEEGGREGRETAPALAAQRARQNGLGAALGGFCVVRLSGWLGALPESRAQFTVVVLASVLLLVLLNAVRRKLSADTHHWLADVALILPALGWLGWTAVAK